MRGSGQDGKGTEARNKTGGNCQTPSLPRQTETAKLAKSTLQKKEGGYDSGLSDPDWQGKNRVFKTLHPGPSRPRNKRPLSEDRQASSKQSWVNIKLRYATYLMHEFC